MQIPDLLKGEKADAQRHKRRLHCAAGEKAGVLENSQHRDMIANGGQKHAPAALPPQGIACQQADGRGRRQQAAAPPDPGGAVPEIEHQTGRQQRPNLRLPTQQAAGADRDGEKGQKGQRLYVHPFRSIWFRRFSWPSAVLSTCTKP